MVVFMDTKDALVNFVLYFRICGFARTDRRHSFMHTSLSICLKVRPQTIDPYKGAVFTCAYSCIKHFFSDGINSDHPVALIL